MKDVGVVSFIDMPSGVEIGLTTVYVRDNIQRVEEDEKPPYYTAHEVQYSVGEWSALKAQELTPYTETKTAYIGDTEITFYDTPTGNLTVYFPYNYTVERLSDRITISFEELEEVTEITISII